MITINRLTRKRSKNVKFPSKKKRFLIKKREIQNSEKNACQKVVTMVASNVIVKDLLYQIVPRYTLEKITKFGGFSLLIKKVINVQRGQNPPPPV